MYLTGRGGREIEQIAREIPRHYRIAVLTEKERGCRMCRFYSRMKKQCKRKHCYFFED
ncbi:hypothetical protein [Christensenella hongkongensis]|uniref:Uncharacterized protein n=1 Tax=Christensenella hongkongensis TaxID=270498 RepID=A0A0M2NHW2_9FIRM|nr:hypothetical protein [Christensenella hongkongensis]KKI50007.1 hypothetical protein CHK_2623 [Christensenella hongkongensis]